MERVWTMVALCAATVVYAEPEISQLWTARGIQAMERLDQYQKSGLDRLTLVERYQFNLEFSLAVQVAQPEIAQKCEASTKTCAFHIVLKSQSGQLLDVRYLYPPGATASTKPKFIAVDSLPKGWQVSFHPERDFIAVVPESGVMLVFSPSDPMEPRAFSTEPKAAAPGPKAPARRAEATPLDQSWAPYR